jgi:ligand-binding sensor domain-containing protein
VTRRTQIGSALAGMLFAAVFPRQCAALDQTGFLRSHLQTRFTNEDGLPAGVVGDMVQSRDGFLWLVANGTALARFDGRHFTFFDEPRHVRALALGPDGDLWVATRDGLERIPLAAQKQFGNLPSIPYRLPAGTSKTVTCLYFSRDGVLWVGTNKGLDRLDGAGFAAVIPGPAIVRIKEASGGRILAITAEEFIEWNGSLAVRHPEIAVRLGIEADKVFDVMEDRNGVTWFCTAKGVARQIGGSLVRIAPYGSQGHGALRAYEDPEGNVWITKADGLYRATTAGIELAVPGVQVRYVYGDRDGDLWVGTNGDGLYRFKTRAIRMFTTADGLPNNVVQTVLASSDGTLWTGANCGGISRFEGGRFQTYNEKDGLSNSCVWDLAEDINHDLWIGTYGGGAFRFHDGRFTQFSKTPGFPSDIVTGVLVAHDQSIWFATHGGLTRMRDGRIRTYTVADGLSSNLVLRLLEDRSGVLWAGTNSGFDRLDGDRFIQVSPLSKNAVFPLGEDPSGIYIYADYPTQEILRFDKNRITSLTSDLKLLSTGMLRTEQGDSWLSGRSIVRLPPNALSQSRATDEPLTQRSTSQTACRDRRYALVVIPTLRGRVTASCGSQPHRD